jgi:hypothetical protein
VHATHDIIAVAPCRASASSASYGGAYSALPMVQVGGAHARASASA